MAQRQGSGELHARKRESGAPLGLNGFPFAVNIVPCILIG